MATALIQSDPPGAFVTLDDELLGVTPMLMDGLMGGNSYTIAVYAVGHEPESFVLTAEPGYHHEMTFQLASLTEPGGVAVAANTGGGGNPLMPDTAVSLPVDPVDTGAVTGGSAGSAETQPADGQHPDEVASGEVAGAGAQQAPEVQPDAGSTVPGTTEELIAMLTAGGIDMASLASAGSLSSLETGNTGIAGSESASGGQVQSGVPLTADAGTQQVMVFSDVQSGSGTVASGGSSYSSRSSDEILEVLNEKRSAIIFIYNKHLRTDPMLMGTVEIEMVIQPSGRVSDVRIVQSNTYNPAFELELARNIETWRFGSVDENEGPLTVQYPFSFSP